jgi:putative inorganic carbon (HCO3(-)) transporter
MNDKKDQFLNQILVILVVLWGSILFWSLAGMQIMLGLVIVCSLLTYLIQKEKPVKFHPFYIVSGIYIIFNLLILISSADLVKSITSFINNDWVIFTIPFIVSLNLSARWRKMVFQAVLVSALVAAFYGIFQFFSGLDLIRHTKLGLLGTHYRAVGAYGSFLSYAGNQLMVFAYAYAFFLLSTKSKIEKTMYLLAAGILLLSIVTSQSRSTWLAIPVILVIGLLAVPKKQLFYAAICLVVIAAGIIMFVPEISSRFLNIFNPAQNETRLNLWKTSLAIIADHPLTGIGSGTFNDYFEIYRVPGFYDARGHAHNDYINKAVISGLIGLITWLAMWVTWFIYMVRVYIRLPEKDDDKKIVLGTMLALSGILIAALFQCYYTDLENNIVWWFMAACGLQISLQKRKSTRLA